MYVLTSVSHSANSWGDYRSGGAGGFDYSNTFMCLPITIPFRPRRKTPKPVIAGTQTAVVVGPEKSEIFTDHYGRVKVQFHWDRRVKGNQHRPLDSQADRSCWIRVAQPWAGKSWGTSFWPRVGQEVLVAFLEGDPDQPIIVGSVYNEDQRPPYLGSAQFPSNDRKHPNNPRLSGVKTCSTPGAKGYNEVRFDDTKGKEQVFLHAQRNLDVRVRGSSMTTVGGSCHLTIGGVMEDGTKYGDLRERVKRDHFLHVEGDSRQRIDGRWDFTVDGPAVEWYCNNHRERTDEEWYVQGKRILIEASDVLCISGPGGFITIGADGIAINGKKVDINCAPAVQPLPVHDPAMAVQLPGEPAGADSAVSGFKSSRD
jgi:type VI secretion system secreted protein VgrG